MENMSPRVLELLSILMILVTCVYFFVFSCLNKISYPWGMGIFIVGLFMSGVEYYFYNNQGVYFSIDLSLVISLLGVFLNLNNVRRQLHVGNAGEFFRFIGTGLVFGILFVVAFITLQGTEYTQVPSGYTKTAIIVMTTQAAIVEELLFRGYFLSYFRKYNCNFIFSIIFQALIFTFLHSSIYWNNRVALLIIFLNGVMSGYLTWKNDNLIPALILHIVFNLIGAIHWLELM